VNFPFSEPFWFQKLSSIIIFILVHNLLSFLFGVTECNVCFFCLVVVIKPLEEDVNYRLDGFLHSHQPKETSEKRKVPVRFLNLSISMLLLCSNNKYFCLSAEWNITPHTNESTAEMKILGGVKG
jgi:hypothetical protein